MALTTVLHSFVASMALFPVPIVAQSGDLNSLSTVLNRFQDLSTFAEIIAVISRPYSILLILVLAKMRFSDGRI